ncbi:hypothetical protein SAMN06265222_11736 [Neorhodopirellula lusitana]|uniref:Lipoprotein n=1 Tax=Neorhodopirellula lusitana TaxID=445327 RepID=A0ABY1QKS1_9BACT|nr:hypothetical protein [Neorhodopirellula lusitana]SMP73884.1 hypothetical protein SAMN06265222_11736 [Neorhodopirellula lusitana]
MEKDMVRKTDKVTWTATLVGWLFTFIGFVVTTLIALCGCQQADRANEIAYVAFEQNKALHFDNQKFQTELQRYQDALTTPRLELLRFQKIQVDRYVVTIQKVGMRQVAIFGANLNPTRVIGEASTTIPRKNVPAEMEMPRINIPFDDPATLIYELPVPAVVDAGQVVSLDITLSSGFTEKEIWIDQSVGQPVFA